MSEAWFGLLGVVVGGAISTIWSWLSVVRAELAEAMVAARLLDEDLRRIEAALGAGEGRHDVRLDLVEWGRQRVSLARVLGRPQWRAVAVVYESGVPRGRGTRVPGADRVRRAREALEPLVEGKRYVVHSAGATGSARPS